MGAPRSPRTPEAPRSSTPSRGRGLGASGGRCGAARRVGCGGPPELRPTPHPTPAWCARLAPAWCARLHISTNTLPPPPSHHTQTPSTQAHTHATPAPMQHTDPPHSTPITPKRVVPRAYPQSHTHTRSHAHNHTTTQPQHSPTQTHKLWSAPLSVCGSINPHPFISATLCFDVFGVNFFVSHGLTFTSAVARSRSALGSPPG